MGTVLSVSDGVYTVSVGTAGAAAETTVEVGAKAIQVPGVTIDAGLMERGLLESTPS